MDVLSRFRGCLLGLAVGDAVGTTVEFQPRGSFEPLTDMVGGGPFHLQPGQWTDDTSMALCLATSLVECNSFDPVDQMERYCRWASEGYLSSTGTCFDIGNTIASSLQSFLRTGDPFAGPTDPQSAGAGYIMRLAPVPMFYCLDPDTAEQHAADSARTTHGVTECLDACRLLARILCRALQGDSKTEILSGDSSSFVGADDILSIARGEYQEKSEADIRGTGHVVASLEAALWSFSRTSTFRDAILMAANLGDDADTTAAVCGQVAGAYYGASGIPISWLEQLALQSQITNLADQLRIAGMQLLK